VAPELFCAQSSLDAGEPLAGTAAANTRAWIVIEVPEPWAAKVLDSEVFAGRRARVESWLAAIPGSRLQLVRKPGKELRGRRLFLASTALGDSWCVALSLGEDLDQLCALDVPALFAERGGPSATTIDRMHLVCTHGKRDACCAKWGVGMYSAAADVDRERVWQSSHVGGHRFAATAVSLPAGICYGRMQPGEAESWLAAEAEGRIYDLARVRGRHCLSGPEQAAELHVRAEQGVLEHAATASVVSRQDGDRHWLVDVQLAETATAVRVESRTTGRLGLGSCGDAEPRPVVELSCSTVSPQ
jgi:hypothetical protein